MEEMQITPEQFEVACLAGKHSAAGLSFHQGLFQQVLLRVLFLTFLLFFFFVEFCIVSGNQEFKSEKNDIINSLANRFGQQMT